MGTLWATVTATLAVGTVGLLKELTDDRLDGQDLLADAAGLTTQAVLQWVVVF